MDARLSITKPFKLYSEYDMSDVILISLCLLSKCKFSLIGHTYLGIFILPTAKNIVTHRILTPCIIIILLNCNTKPR